MRRNHKAWREDVLREPKLADSTRVLLLHIADNHMRNGRKFSVPRKQLAEELNRHERRITERISDAHNKGWLVTVSPGYLGHTAVYEATWPDALCGTDRSPHQQRDGFPPSSKSDLSGDEPVMRDGFPPTTTKANLSLVGCGRNVANDEQAEWRCAA